MTEQQHPMLTKNFQQLKAEVESHVKADSVAQGGYETCFIGCLANQSDDPQHIENTYGIPEIVSRIAEAIFEGLRAAEAPAFFGALPDAVACDGKDLSRVPWQFLAAELRALPTVEDKIQTVIDPVIAGMDLLAEGKEWDKEDASAAASAVWATDSAADSAVRAAVWATDSAADSAVRAAVWAAAKATDSAADSAVRAAVWAAAKATDSAAANAASAVVRCRQRDLLLKLISEAPVIAQENNQ